MKKDFEWNIKGINYAVRNVPYERLDVEGEEVVDLDIAVKLEMIRELMLKNKISNEVNYEVVSDLELI